MFEWDEAKRLATLEKHDLDFYDIIDVFTQDFLRLAGPAGNRNKGIAVGILNVQAIAVVYTMRAETVRSSRRGMRDEMNEKDLKRISLEEPHKTKGRTDWDKVRARGDYEGPQEFEVDWSRVELVERPSKKLVSLRIDEDVLDFFKAQGKGYQTKINAVLRAYKASMTKS